MNLIEGVEMTGIIVLIGVLCGVIVLYLAYPQKRSVGRLAELYSVDSLRTLSDLNPNSLEYRLMASGINYRPVTWQLLCLSAGTAAAAVTWLVLPGLPALVVGGIAYYLPNAWLDDKVKSRGREIDKCLPIAIGRIAAGLLAGGSVPDVLQQVGQSLQIEAANPLTPELMLTATELRTKDRREALRNLAQRSPSVSLANLAQLLEGYSEAGGARYASVLMDISQRVQQILIARNRAQAKAGDSVVSTRVLPGVLLLIIVYLSSDPMVQQSLHAFPVQIAIALTMAAMIIGYFVMRSMVLEAV
jgi:tight adherence protein B